MLTLLCIYISTVLLSFCLAVIVVREDLIEGKSVPVMFFLSVIPLFNLTVIMLGVTVLYDNSRWAETLGYKLKAIIKGESK